ncbi:hypothetical protein KUH03_23880 [Sphingobacterium sp. E70]|uniref:hypothetical protein n=1 Tax=Sphingobacterium sp. E70 TaxID=2853439 RepID=UPI00211CB3B3|nr:hypothetical protein [Sphingobacterium sp. E70]ULT22442.1 hypothetical protein KUH03_23880 [Sphingobacterium sp. E70]
MLRIDLGIFKDGMGLFGEKVTTRSVQDSLQLALNVKGVTGRGLRTPMLSIGNRQGLKS